MEDSPILIDCCPNARRAVLERNFAAIGCLIPVSADFLSIRGGAADAALNVLQRGLKRNIERKWW